MHDEPIHPAVRVGHVHLRVADLDRALAFYRDALGLTVTGGRPRGRPAHGPPGGRRLPPPHRPEHVRERRRDPASPGAHRALPHAFVYPDRRELGRAVARLLAHGVEIDHGTDHGGTVSVYLDDPDGNGVELYYDRPRSEWFTGDGRPVLRNDRFDPQDLLTRRPLPKEAPE